MVRRIYLKYAMNPSRIVWNKTPPLVLGPISTWNESKIIVDRKSQFQGFHIQLTDSQHIPEIITQFKQQHKRLCKSASHPHIYAWRTGTKSEDTYTNVKQGHFDCGETGGGSELLKRVIYKYKLYNVLVIVSRWMHGGSIGPARFKHIGHAGCDLILKNISKL